jgi:hypothetical protein
MSTFGTLASSIVIGPAFPHWGLVQAVCTACEAQLLSPDGACWCPPLTPAEAQAADDRAIADAEYRFTSAEYRAELAAPLSGWEH